MRRQDISGLKQRTQNNSPPSDAIESVLLRSSFRFRFLFLKTFRFGIIIIRVSRFRLRLGLRLRFILWRHERFMLRLDSVVGRDDDMIFFQNGRIYIRQISENNRKGITMRMQILPEVLAVPWCFRTLKFVIFSISSAHWPTRASGHMTLQRRTIVRKKSKSKERAAKQKCTKSKHSNRQLYRICEHDRLQFL